jgi:hypothetical protein
MPDIGFVQLEVRETLGSYRDCRGRRGWVGPGHSGRGSFDRIVCTDPLVLAGDAVIYLWKFNRASLPNVAVLIAELEQRSGNGSLSERS